MNRHFCAAVVVVVLALSSPALADWDGKGGRSSYPEEKANRPVTLGNGMVRVGGEIGIGFLKGREGEDMTMSLDLAYGVTGQLELGLGLDFLNRYAGTDSPEFGGWDVYLLYAPIKQVGLRIALYMPGTRAWYGNMASFPGVSPYTDFDHVENNKVGLEFSVPLRVVVWQNHLNLHGSIGWQMGFVHYDNMEIVGIKYPQGALCLSYGLTYNPMTLLWLDVTAETFMVVLGFPDISFHDRTQVPFSLTGGVTLLKGKLDLYASFRFANLNIPDGSSADPGDIFAIMLGASGQF